MEDIRALEASEEVRDTGKGLGVSSPEESIEEPKSNKKQKIVKEIKESKKVYDIVLVFNDYKNRLDKYFEVDGRIVYDRFGKELTAKLVADKLIARGILVEIKSVDLL